MESSAKIPIAKSHLSLRDITKVVWRHKPSTLPCELDYNCIGWNRILESKITCWNDSESWSPMKVVYRVLFFDRSTSYQPSGWLHRLAGSRMVDFTIGFKAIIPLLLFVRLFLSPLSWPSVALLTDSIYKVMVKNLFVRSEIEVPNPKLE